MRGFILPQAFRVVFDDINPHQMRLDEVTSQPLGLSVKGTWALSMELTSPRKPFTVYIPREKWGDLLITAALPQQIMRKLGEAILEILTKIHTCEAIRLNALALHADASYTQVELGVGLVFAKDNHAVQLAPFYYPGTMLSSSSYYLSIYCAASLLEGDTSVEITTVHEGHGEEVPAKVLSRSTVQVAHDNHLGITFKYRLGEEYFGFAVCPEDWEGALWLLRRTLRDEPYLISLPDPTVNASEVVLATEENTHTFMWTTAGSSVFASIYPEDKQYFPLTVEFSPAVLQRLRHSPIFRRRYREEESFPVITRDAAGNRIVDHPCQTIRFRQDGAGVIIRFPYVYGGSWPRGSSIAKVDGLRLLKVIKSLNGQIYRRQNEAAG